MHGEIVAFLCTYPALNTGEFQIRQIGRKGIYQVSYFTTKYSADQPTQMLAMETEHFQVEKGDSRWQIRSPMVALPDVEVESSDERDAQ